MSTRPRVRSGSSTTGTASRSARSGAGPASAICESRTIRLPSPRSPARSSGWSGTSSAPSGTSARRRSRRRCPNVCGRSAGVIPSRRGTGRRRDGARRGAAGGRRRRDPAHRDLRRPSRRPRDHACLRCVLAGGGGARAGGGAADVRAGARAAAGCSGSPCSTTRRSRSRSPIGARSACSSQAAQRCPRRGAVVAIALSCGRAGTRR